MCNRRLRGKVEAGNTLATVAGSRQNRQVKKTTQALEIKGLAQYTPQGSNLQPSVP